MPRYPEAGVNLQTINRQCGKCHRKAGPDMEHCARLGDHSGREAVDMSYDNDHEPDIGASTEIAGAWIFAAGIVGAVLFFLGLFI